MIGSEPSGNGSYAFDSSLHAFHLSSKTSIGYALVPQNRKFAVLHCAVRVVLEKAFNLKLDITAVALLSTVFIARQSELPLQRRQPTTR